MPLEIKFDIDQQKICPDYFDKMIMAWKIYYWVNFYIGYFVLPVVILYHQSGKFSFIQKLKDSVQGKITFYFIFVAFGCFLYLKLSEKQEYKKSIDLAMIIYNSLFYIIYLLSLGYGLCKLPLKYFKRSDLKKNFRSQLVYFYQIKEKYEQIVIKLHQKLLIYELIKHKYPDNKKELLIIKYKIKDIKIDHQKYNYVVIYPKQLRKFKGNLSDLEEFHHNNKKLHFKYQTIKSQYFHIAFSCCYLDYLCENIYPEKYKSIIKQSFIHNNSDIIIQNYQRFKPISKKYPNLDIFYHKYIFSLVKILLGLVSTIFSILIFTIQILSLLNPEANKQMIKYLSSLIGSSSTLFILLIVMIYILLSVHYFMFKFNYYNLIGIKWGKKTNLLTLYNSSSMFSYLTFPIVVNFYHIFLPKGDSAFEKALGQKKIIQIAGYNLLNYFPGILIIMLFLTWFDFGFLQKKQQITKRKFRQLRKIFREDFIEVIEDHEFGIKFNKNKNLFCKSILNN